MDQSKKILRRLKGWQKAPRARFLLLTQHRMSHEEFILYELGIALTDWDETHNEDYGSFGATNQELSNILGWKSDTSTLKHKHALIEKKFFEVRTDGRIIVRGFERWILRKQKKQDTTSFLKDNGAEIKDQTSYIEEDYPQDSTYPLVSSKVNVVSSNQELEYVDIDRVEEDMRRKGI